MQISLPPNTWAQLSTILEMILEGKPASIDFDTLSEALAIIRDEIDNEAERQFLARLTGINQ